MGFTISAILAGLVYGLVLYKKGEEFTSKSLIIRLIISTMVVTLFVNMILGTLWLVIMYDKAFFVLLGTRAIKEVIMLPIQVVVIFVLDKFLRPFFKKYLYQ